MKKGSIIGVLVAALIYLMLYPATAACGLIGPACFAYVDCRESNEKTGRVICIDF